MVSQRSQISVFFSPLAPTMRGYHVWLNYPYSNVKKMVFPKNVWKWHCSRANWERRVKEKVVSYRELGALSEQVLEFRISRLA